jgi:hypothetical protein
MNPDRNPDDRDREDVMRPDNALIGTTCEKCKKGRLLPTGPNGVLEYLKGIVFRKYDLRLQCDNEECGNIVLVEGVQLRHGASIRKMQDRS